MGYWIGGGWSWRSRRRRSRACRGRSACLCRQVGQIQESLEFGLGDTDIVDAKLFSVDNFCTDSFGKDILNAVTGVCQPLAYFAKETTEETRGERLAFRRRGSSSRSNAF